MSNRSIKTPRAQKGNLPASPRKPAATPARSSLGGTVRKAMWLAVAVVVVAAVVYAVSGDGGRKAEVVSAPVTNLASSIPSAPTLPLPSPTAGLTPAGGGSGPKIQFLMPVYDFGQIKGGEVVKYSFVFTNAGDRVLELANVSPSCGCTTAGEWTRKVEPGNTGRIPIEFNSGNFGGQVAKTITVTCNDLHQPTVTLQIQGNVWKPIVVTPQYVMLNVTSEAPSNTTTVRIVSNEEVPLRLSAPEISNPAFVAELTTTQPGKEFQLMVKTVPPLAVGMVQGKITLKTSSSTTPIIDIPVYANVQQAVPVAQPANSKR